MMALQMCRKIKNKMYDEEIINGKVHSVFKTACNIITTDDELISILTCEKFISPMSVVVGTRKKFAQLGIKQNLPVRIIKKHILFKEINLDIDLSKTKIWDFKPNFNYIKDTEENIINKLRYIEEYMYRYGNSDGISNIVFCLGNYVEELKTYENNDISLNQYSKFIIHRITKFLKLCMDDDRENISEAAKKIIGFGPGLTPSADDFIVGLMTSFIYLSDYFGLDILKVYEFNKEIVKDIRNRTTLVSEKMLMFASVGEVSEGIKRLMKSFLSISEEKEFINSLIDVLNFGGTSGTDILSGIYVGSKIIVRKNVFRGMMEGES
ncbi:DUF2877 domain-containing protein [Lutibacter sp. B2]|nr:DUF2877 domain-containing protein [Lutibacter sp. B2]